MGFSKFLSKADIKIEMNPTHLLKKIDYCKSLWKTSYIIVVKGNAASSMHHGLSVKEEITFWMFLESHWQQKGKLLDMKIKII